MTELSTLKFTSLKPDISIKIYQMAGTIDQLKRTNVTIGDSFSVATPVPLIKEMALRPASAAFKTLDEDDPKWETVAARVTNKAERI